MGRDVLRATKSCCKLCFVSHTRLEKSINKTHPDNQHEPPGDGVEGDVLAGDLPLVPAHDPVTPPTAPPPAPRPPVPVQEVDDDARPRLVEAELPPPFLHIRARTTHIVILQSFLSLNL